jgi:hypothetical protein
MIGKTLHNVSFREWLVPVCVDDFCFAAAHESGCGTSRTWRDVRPESAKPAKADIDQPSLIRHDEGLSRRRFDFRSIAAINTPKDFNAE